MAFLALLAGPPGLPASTGSTTLAPGEHLQGLWTTAATKASLKNATTSFLAMTAEKTKAKSKGQCWMWSDPHVETLGGASADFMPHKDPVHTLVAKEGGYKIQSYHCPVVQETCKPDYYPCGASAAVAYAGSFTDKSGETVSVVMWGQRVVLCGKGGKCKEVDLGVKGDWTPTSMEIGDGCFLKRKMNRANVGNGDSVKSPGDYETSFTCGGAKLVTWYYDEVHMPTGYLMNALVTVPDEDKDSVTGLCHSTTGDDATATTCKKDGFYKMWATEGPVDILAKIGKACGSTVPDCNPKSPSPSPPPSPPPPSPPKLEWGYITDVNDDPEIVGLYDTAVKDQTITFPPNSNSEYCVKVDEKCSGADCERTCTPCDKCDITEHHETCEAKSTSSDAETSGNKLKEDGTSHLPTGAVTVEFKSKVSSDKGEHGCCSALSCVGWYFQSSQIESPANTKFRFQFKASKEADYFEIVAALYKVPKKKIGEDGKAPPKSGNIVKRVVLRGASMEDFLKEEFVTDEPGNYYLGFFAASYDFTAGRNLGAILTVKSFEYELPSGEVLKSA